MPENKQKSTFGEPAPDFEFKDIDELEEASPVFDDEESVEYGEIDGLVDEGQAEAFDAETGGEESDDSSDGVGVEEAFKDEPDKAVDEERERDQPEVSDEAVVSENVEGGTRESENATEPTAEVVEDEPAEVIGEPGGQSRKGVVGDEPKTKTVLPTSRNRGHRNLAAVAFGGQAAGSDEHRHFGCPNCAQPIDVSPEDEGGKKECMHCGATVEVPEIHRFEKEQDKEGEVPLKITAAEQASGVRTEMEKKAALHRLGPDRQPPLIPKGEDGPALSEGTWNDDHPAHHPVMPQLPAPSTSMWKKIGFVAVLLLVLTVVGVNLLILNKGEQAAKEELRKKLEEPPPLKTADQLLAEKLLKRMEEFRATRSIEGRLEFVRSPERAEPRMSRYYSNQGLDAILPTIQPRTLTRDLLFGRSFVKFVGRQNRRDVFIYFEDKGGEEFKIDWESMVGYADSNWKSFVVNQPLESYAFRLLVSRDDYYNYKFADPTVYLCVQLVDVNDSARCYGYVKRDGSIGRLLLDSLGEGEILSCRVVVRVAEPGTDRHQVVIEKLDIGWLEE